MKTAPSAGVTGDHDPVGLPDAVIDAAIAWSVKLDYSVATPASRDAFARWLSADPLHAEAWRRIGQMKSDFSSMPTKLALETLQAADAVRRDNGARERRRKTIKLLTLGAVGIAAGWTARDHAPWQRLLADASTGAGEQKTLDLADGTVLVLNTDSAVSTNLRGERRLIFLRRGEILVTTGADSGASARRPFWVYTPFGKMQALGTRFTVRLDAEQARISVQEGAVELHPAGGAAGAIVRPGQTRWLSEAGTEPADLRGFEADAWADGVVAGKNMRLADLLAELERYRSGRIVCDARVADLRVSGLYHIRDTERTLHFLAQTHPIAITYRTRYWVTVGPAT